jgi:DICT domain-containing protein/putative methionine-R-sulfoxide reductase with GAF domain
MDCSSVLRAIGASTFFNSQQGSQLVWTIVIMNISLFRSIANQYKDLRRVNTVTMMNTISRQIEEQIAQHRLAIDLYVGFQKYSNFIEQFRRYGRLGTICRRVFVFGVADYQPPTIPGIEFVEIPPASALSHEWFVLVNTPDFWTTLVAKELETSDPITADRQFDAVWSFDEHIVERISLLVAQALEFSYMPVQRRNYEQQNMHISAINSQMLGLVESSEFTSHRRWLQLCTLRQLTDVNAKQINVLLRTTGEILHTVFGATSVAILLNHTTDYYIVAASEGDVLTSGRPIPLTEGLGGQVIHAERMIQIKDVNLSQAVEPLMPNAKTLIAAPIAGRRIYGAVLVGSQQTQAWNEEDGETLQSVARLLATKLEQLTAEKPVKKSLPEMTQHWQQVVTEQQKPTARLLALQQKLRVLGGLTPVQEEVLNEMATASASLVQTIKSAKHLLPDKV